MQFTNARKGNGEALIAQPSFSVEKNDLVNKNLACYFFNEKLDVKRHFRSWERIFVAGTIWKVFFIFFV